MEQQCIGVFTIQETVQRGIELHKKTFKNTFCLLAIPGLFQGFIHASQSHDVFLVSSAQTPPNLFLVCLFILTTGWAQICMTRNFYELSQGKNNSLQTIFNLAQPKDLLYLITTILIGTLLVLSLFALVIPFFYLANLYPIFYVVIIVERTYYLGWWKRGFFLTRDRWWKTCGVNSVSSLFLIIPFMVSTTLQFIPSVSPFFSWCITFAGFTLVSPLFYAISVVYYNSLVYEKQHTM